MCAVAGLCWQLTLSCKQGRAEFRWRLGQETSLAPPCSNLSSFRSKCTVLKKVIATLLGLFCAPPRAVVQRPEHCNPLVTPLHGKHDRSMFSVFTDELDETERSDPYRCLPRTQVDRARSASLQPVALPAHGRLLREQAAREDLLFSLHARRGRALRAAELGRAVSHRLRSPDHVSATWTNDATAFATSWRALAERRRTIGDFAPLIVFLLRHSVWRSPRLQQRRASSTDPASRDFKPPGKCPPEVRKHRSVAGSDLITTSSPTDDEIDSASSNHETYL